MKSEQHRSAGRAPADLQAIPSRARRALICVGMLLPAALLFWGCAGFVNGQNSNPPPPPPPQTYSISGTISPVIGGNGATITLGGAASATTTANASGSYTFAGLANGTYTITPSHASYTFNPTSLNATVNGANIAGINFTDAAQTYSISGTISPSAGGNGATVTLSGVVSATTIANSAGNYTFSGLSNGAYAVTPSRMGYTFSPGVQGATINGASVTGVNFTAQAQVGQTFSISGTISPIAGGSGASVVLSGAAAATTITDSAGNYSFASLASGTYLVTPANAGYTFSPVNQNVTISTANVSGVNFTAAAQVTHTVALAWNASTSTVSGYNIYRSTLSGTGYARINSSLVALLSYTDSNVLNGTTYYYVTTAVDASGSESVYSNEVSALIP